MTADPLATFAAAAEAFAAWARDGTDTGADAARNALRHLTRLYAAALELPPHLWSGDDPDVERRTYDDYLAVRNAVGRRLPLDYYGEVFRPTVMPPEEPVVGSLADDLADIDGDVIRGLVEYRAGRPKSALWEWGFGFVNHWGEHTTGAIRALHSWLAENAPERLAADRPA